MRDTGREASPHAVSHIEVALRTALTLNLFVMNLAGPLACLHTSMASTLPWVFVFEKSSTRDITYKVSGANSDFPVALLSRVFVAVHTHSDLIRFKKRSLFTDILLPKPVATWSSDSGACFVDHARQKLIWGFIVTDQTILLEVERQAGMQLYRGIFAEYPFAAQYCRGGCGGNTYLSSPYESGFTSSGGSIVLRCGEWFDLGKTNMSIPAAWWAL